MRKMLNNDHGLALVFVLWVLVILGVIAGGFSYSMRNEVRTAMYIKDETQAYYIAYAGMNFALQKFAENEIGNGNEKDDTKIIWRVNTEIPAQSFDRGEYKIRIGNESGKINLNYAESDFLKILVSHFAVEKEISDVIVDSILDWRDKDALHRLNGAENDYYQSLPEPYKCRDGLFRSVDELLLVRGITKEMFYGGMKNFVTVAIIKGFAKDKQGGKKKITGNRKRININAVSPELLSIFPMVTKETVESIILYRKEKDINSFTDLIALTGSDISVGIRKFIDYKNNRFYTFDSSGWIEGQNTKLRIRVMIKEMPMTQKGYRIVRWIDSVSDY